MDQFSQSQPLPEAPTSSLQLMDRNDPPQDQAASATVVLRLPRSASQQGPSRHRPSRDPRSWSLSDLPPHLQDMSTWITAEEILQVPPVADEINPIFLDSQDLDGPADEIPQDSSVAYERNSTTPDRRELEDGVWISDVQTPPTPSPQGTLSSERDVVALDLPQVTRARLYNYYVARCDNLRVLCDEAQQMTDFPTNCPEDFELLKMVTKTYGDRRWWTVLINNLACLDCVKQLNAERKRPKSKFRTLWLKVKSQFKQVLRYEENYYDFRCNHKTSKVARFFRTLGEDNASRMVNIELDTKAWALVDTEVLASAVHNLKLYCKNIRMLSIQFHLCEPVPIDKDRIARIVCSLAQMEAMLPWRERLMVLGFEKHEACQIAWAKKSRRWWE